MTKQELVAAVAREAGLTKTDAERAINAFTKVVLRTVKKGDKVTLVGFGTFSRLKRQARMGINPATKERIRIRARKVLKFKPSEKVQL